MTFFQTATFYAQLWHHVTQYIHSECLKINVRKKLQFLSHIFVMSCTLSFCESLHKVQKGNVREDVLKSKNIQPTYYVLSSLHKNQEEHFLNKAHCESVNLKAQSSMKSSNTRETFFADSHNSPPWRVIGFNQGWETLFTLNEQKTMYWKCTNVELGTLKIFWYLSSLQLFLKNSGAVYWGIDKHISNLHAKHNSRSFSLWRTWLLGGKIMP